MSAILNATVAVRVDMQGTGNIVAKSDAATKSLANLKQQVGATGAAAAASTKSTSDFVSGLSGLKDSVSPVNKTRETFENLRSNLLGFPLAIAGAVGGIASLVAGFLEAGSASERLREKSDDYKKALEGIQNGLEKLREFNRGGSDKGPLIGLVGADAGDKLDEANDKLSTLQEHLRDLRSSERSAGALFGFTKDGLANVGDIDSRYIDIKKTENEIRDIERDIRDYRNESVSALEKQKRILDTLATGSLSGMAKGAGQGNVIDLDAIRGGALVVTRPRGGGGSRRETAADLIKGLSRGSDNAERSYLTNSAADEARARADRLSGYSDMPSMLAVPEFGSDAGMGAGSRRRGGGLSGGIVGSTVGAANAARDAAKDVRDFTAALSEALPGMGAFSDALNRVASVWSKWGSEGFKTKDAIVGSLGAIATAGAEQIKNERLRAGVLSIIELGLGFANIENPPVAAAHFAAAATLGGVALFGGSSGKSGGRGASTSSGAGRAQRLQGEMLGQRAVGVTIYGNYYAFGKGDQEAASDVQRLTHRADGTGFERAA